ncbi:hypothetical protein ACFQV2_14615 [Actinokineospora soli]|uniref:DUF5666 domain-containing protein n=1 Tax=Actinokineospora soli TaxID=1048753 RepID=A0ABW2TNH4_9PSEU
MAAVVAALVSPGAGAAAPEGRGPASGTTVTLLTGDRVTLVGGRARVEPGEGRERVRFLQRVDEEGDVHVLPADVAGEVAAGRLDGRLFDVGGWSGPGTTTHAARSRR